MKKITVLGAGMIGSAIAIDLAKNFNIQIADINKNTLLKLKEKNSDIQTIQVDFSDEMAFIKLIEDCDIVVCAVPGFMGFNTLKKIIKAKKNVVDISFFAEDAFELDNLAKKNNVTAIVDCGVAPGLDNIILAHYNQKMKITDFECYVGGLPKVRNFPFSYKAPFSPIDVIEEYTRPARYVSNFELITKEPLSDCEFLHFNNIGTLEAFNSDGLRSLIKTMPHIKNMKEKTLRYPGHAEYISILKESGFFDKNKIKINGTEISPLEFSSKILFKNWFLNEGDDEFTAMRIIIKSDAKNVIANIYDENCKKTQTSSMARTTGYTACAAVNILLEDKFNSTGINPPEFVGKNEAFYNYIIQYLKNRNISIEIEEQINQ